VEVAVLLVTRVKGDVAAGVGDHAGLVMAGLGLSLIHSTGYGAVPSPVRDVSNPALTHSNHTCSTLPLILSPL